MATTQVSAHSYRFKHKKLTAHIGRPNNRIVTTWKQELHDNACSIECHLGGRNSHEFLIMTAAAFNALPGAVAVVPPVWPNIHPVYPANATAAQIHAADRTHAADKEIYRDYIGVGNCLVDMMLDAVENSYVEELAIEGTGYRDVTILQLLQHLQTRYGTIDDDALDTNQKTFEGDINLDEPIEKYITRLKECRRIATAGNDAISDRTYMRIFLATMERTGVFTEAVKDWRDKEDADKTVANIKTHFTEANTERLRKMTAQSAGFHGANQTTTTTLAPAAPGDAATNKYCIVCFSGKKMYYCWSHGLGLAASHTSASCRNRQPNHDESATVEDRKGGSTNIMGERSH